MFKLTKNKTHFFIVGFFLTISALLHAADQNKSPVFSQQIAKRFSVQWINLPQEKTYLQTDKPYYSAGEEIWFKAYLVNATTLEPNALSQFVYVELIDKRDSVLYRVKIKKDSLGFAGQIKLKPEIPTGYYSLRSYTYWMQNVGTDFLYSKNILIGNSIDDKILSKITYGTPVDGSMPAILTFTDANHNPVVGKKVEITQNWESAGKKRFSVVTGSDGKIQWQLKVDSKDNSKKSIEVSIEEEKYKSNIFVPEFSSDYDVQFFPESGILLSGVLQTIAFKAIAKNGLSVQISGKVFNNKNEEIGDLATLNKGMGKFSLQTQSNENYYAIVKNAEGIEKRFDLPKVQQTGVVMRLFYNKGKILYEVSNHTNVPDKSLYLVLHSRGKVFVVQSLMQMEGQISESLLPAGIASLSVIDSLGNTYCERLCFVRNFNLPVITMQSDKASYGKRESVNLSLNVQNALGKPVNGNFSISVTDSRTVKQDSLADNILTNLLLTSDIKGFVEDPAAYFADNKSTTREMTDVLMMTQGWRRFNTADVVKGEYKKPKFYMEIGQTLSGKVTNLINAPSKQCDIYAISPYRSIVKMTKTDSLGRYLIDGIEFPDSTSFVMKAKKSKSITDVEIIPDKDIFPEPKTFIPTPLKANIATEQDEYFKQSKEKYYMDGGMRVISLDEVTVKAAKKSDTNKNYYSGLGDSQVKPEQLEQYKNMNVIDLLNTVPGVVATSEKISVRGSANSPLVLIDDIQMIDMSELTYLTADDIVGLEVFKGVNTIIFGSRGSNGVIVITLKKGEDRKTTPPISLAHVIPLGYQKPAEFYVPAYNVDSVYKKKETDLRTTIYWNPKLTTDKDGTIHVNFFTADKSNNYSVVLEGISNTGEICRYVGILKREDK